VRNDRGQVVELWNLRPDYMEIIKDKTKLIKAYKFNKTDGTSEYFLPQDIVHHKYPSPLDLYFGISPVRSAQTRIDTEASGSEYQRDFFLNNARPDAAIKTSQPLSPKQKNEMREAFGKRHQGRGKNSKLAIFEAGIEYQQLSISQREMDYIESMKFTRDDILVAFGVPKAIVAITDDVNRANAETSMYIFLSETIRPEIEMLTEKMNIELVTPDFGDNLFLSYDDPTPENREQTIREYEVGLKNGYLMINEVRENENKEPIEGGWSLRKPFNEIVVGGTGQDKEVKTEAKQVVMMEEWQKRQDDEKARARAKIFVGRSRLKAKLELKEKMLIELRKAFKPKSNKEKTKDIENVKVVNKVATALIKEDVRYGYASMVIKQINSRAQSMEAGITKLARSQGEALVDLLKINSELTKSKKNRVKAIGPETKETIKKFFKAQEPVFASFSFPYIEEFVRSAGLEAMMIVDPNGGFIMSDQIRKTVEKRSEEFGLGINKTTRDKVTKQINEGLAEGEGVVKISDRINNTYKEFPTWRSDMIARTESTAANNEGFIEAYKQSGVTTHKEWIAVMDARTRPEHQALDGKIVKVGERFSNGLMYPQEPNCRCVIGPAFEK